MTATTLPTRDLMSGVPRGVIARDGCALGLEEQAMPLAAFMGLDAIRASEQLRAGAGKIFLGVVDGNAERRGTEAHVLGGQAVGLGDDRHCVTVAGSRAGKGRSVVIPTLLSYEGSVLSIDPKAELATITARHRVERLRQRGVALDPFMVTSGYAASLRAGFNPMSVLTPDSATLIEDAGLIADGLVVRENSNSGDPHWDDSARGFIEGVVVHVATAPEHAGRRHLGTVRDLIMGSAEVTQGKGLDRVEAEMRSNAAAHGVVQDAAEDFFSKPDDERGSVLSTARRHIRFLAYPAIRDNIARDDLDLASLKREKVTVYLCLPAMRMGTCNRWFRLVVNMALAAFEREPAKPSPPVLMVLDEFATLGHMRTIEDAAGQLAGFGIKLWPILQDLGQLKALYKDRWQTFLGNAGAVQFFGNSDLTTLDYIAKRLGTTSVIVKNQSEVADRDQTRTDRRGAAWNVQTPSLMTVDEIARIFGRDDALQRQLVIWSGFDPLILSRIKYDSHELFRGLYDAAR
jgi:type IV secretion system protein VirD4